MKKTKQRIAIVNEDDRWKIVDGIMEILVNSDLSYFETLGVLDECKEQVKGIAESNTCSECGRDLDDDEDDEDDYEDDEDDDDD